MTSESQASPSESAAAESVETRQARDLVAQTILAWRATSTIPPGPCTRDFLDQHPEIARHRSLVLDLAVEEYCLRRDHGEPIDATTFAAQFPTIGEALGKVLNFYVRHLSDFDIPDNSESVPWPNPDELVSGCLLLQELGRSHFSRVYLASELEIGQRLVVLKLSSGASTEAKNLGKLQHPNIVPILSVKHVPHQHATTNRKATLTIIVMPFMGRTTLADVISQTWHTNRRPVSSDDVQRISRDGTLGEDVADGFSPPNIKLPYNDYTRTVVAIVAQLAEALDHAHKQNIVHRDIKPSNVLLTPTCTPMLMDFNISTDLDRRLPDEMAGTLPYMPPENLECLFRRSPPTPQQSINSSQRSLAHNTSENDPGPHKFENESRESPLPPQATTHLNILSKHPAKSHQLADVFSLGALLYELLTGSLPYGSCAAIGSVRSKAAEMYRRHQRFPLVRNRLNSHLDADIFQYLDKCLSPTPAQRPETAAEMATDLRRYLELRHQRDQAAERIIQRRRWTSFALVTVVMLIAFSCLYHAYSYCDHYAEGLDEYARGDFDRAIKHFSQAIDECDDAISTNYAQAKETERRLRTRSVIFFARAQAFRRLRKFHEADGDLTRAIAHNRSPRIASCLAYVRGFLGHDKDAMSIYDMTLADIQAADRINLQSVTLKDRVMILNNNGYHCSRSGRLVAARHFFDLAGRIDPDGPLSDIVFLNGANVALRLVTAEFLDLDELDEIEQKALKPSRTAPERGEFILLAAKIASVRYQRTRRREDELKVVSYVCAAVANGIAVNDVKADPYLEQYVGDSVALVSAREGRIRDARDALIEPSADPKVDDWYIDSLGRVAAPPD